MDGKLQGYTKSRLKSSSFIHEAKQLKTTRCSCPRHANYSTVYDWHHEPSRKFYINSGNLHDGTSPWAENRWWHYQAYSDTSHDLWTEQWPSDAWTNFYTGGSATNAIQDSKAGITISFPSDSTQATSGSNTNTLQQLQSRVWGIDDGHLSCCGITTEEHHGCMSHWCALISTSPDQQQIATSGKNYSATTAEWPFNGYPPNAEFLEINKQTRLQSKVHKQSNQMLMWATNYLMMPIQEKEPYHILSRPEQVIMVIPRTRNNQWNAHMNKK